MKIECYGEKWVEVLVKEILGHCNIPDSKKYEANVSMTDMDGKYIYLYYEFFDETLEPYDEGDEPGGWNESSMAIRYWIDQEWPRFCLSYCLFDENHEEIEDGAYELVYRRGKGKCVPID